MPIFNGDQGADAPEIEGGIYPAIFTGVTEKKQVKSQFGTEDKYIWNFDLYEPGYTEQVFDPSSGEAVSVDRMTSQKMNVKSKQVPGGIKVLKALMTAAEFTAFEAGTSTVSDEDLEGRKCQVVVVIRENGWPTAADVLPAAKERKPKAAVEPEED